MKRLLIADCRFPNGGIAEARFFNHQSSIFNLQFSS
jgi:hypothetical protein